MTELDPTARSSPEPRVTPREALALALVSWALLTLELSLIRVFDVTLGPNVGFLVLTVAMLALGGAGSWLALRPVAEPPARLARAALVLAASTAGLTLGLDALPLDLDRLQAEPWSQGAWLALLCVACGVPFFAAGVVISGVLALEPRRVGALYGASLLGSALGCVTLAPLIAPIGPGGAMLLACAGAVLAAGLLARGLVLALLLAAGLVAAPLLRRPAYFDFREHHDRFDIRSARERGAVELTRWDPVSKIDVVRVNVLSPETGEPIEPFKFVLYDGGTQTTRFTPFDGDIEELRRELEARPALSSAYFWQRGVLAAHHLKRDTGARVLVLGTAGGQDTLAALLYGAGHVDALEMVAGLVELVTTTYSDYIGRIFERPDVRLVADEGRSFLRASDEQYDIIQIFSNNTSSTMGSGTGFLETVYLQTVEAYEEYFRHLADDGVLQVNHHVYPRLITTAARAWRNLGRTEFQRHVAVFERSLEEELLPTVLFKMSPWTAGELAELQALFAERGLLEDYAFELVENPLQPAASFLSPDFYERELGAALLERIPYRVTPCTDDRPFFNFLRRRHGRIEPAPARFLERTTAAYLNHRLLGAGLPAELLPIGIPLAAALLLVPPVVLLPLLRRRPGRRSLATATYFACLGCGFLLLELVLIQMVVQLVGRPLHAHSVVLTALLLGAGAGSGSSARIGLAARGRWWLPFAGILLLGLALMLGFASFTRALLAEPLALRLAGATAVLMPLGFFLGMPFPLGIRAIADGGRVVVGWAWGVNAVCAVAGSLAFACLAPTVGFRATLQAALVLYLVAWAALRRMRKP